MNSKFEKRGWLVVALWRCNRDPPLHEVLKFIVNVISPSTGWVASKVI